MRQRPKKGAAARDISLTTPAAARPPLLGKEGNGAVSEPAPFPSFPRRGGAMWLVMISGSHLFKFKSNVPPRTQKPLIRRTLRSRDLVAFEKKRQLTSAACFSQCY